MKAIGRRTTKGMKWKNDTIKKALKISFAAGPTGYKTLQELQSSNQNPAKKDGFIKTEGRWIGRP